jgi:hypothetical protein
MLLFADGRTTERTVLPAEGPGRALGVPMRVQPVRGELIVEIESMPCHRSFPRSHLAGREQGSLAIKDRGGSAVRGNAARRGSAACAVARRKLATVSTLRRLSCEKPRKIIPKRKKYSSCGLVIRRSNFERRMTIHITPVPPVTLASVPGPQATMMVGAKWQALPIWLPGFRPEKGKETLARQRSRKDR